MSRLHGVCTFHTLLLPAKAPLDAVNAVARDVVGHGFIAQGHAALEAAVVQDAHAYITDGHCDCGSELTRTPRQPRAGKRAGWSQAKIDRWFAQQAANYGPTPQARWAQLVRNILDRELAAWVGVFTHVYRGSVRDEAMTIRPLQRFHDATAERLAQIKIDVPFVFTRP
jgi:hypothetical protein